MATKTKTKARAAGTFQYDSSAPANPTLLNYPADPYGLCSELRKSMTKMVGRLHGDSKKLAIAERNLALLIGHMYSRFAEQGGVLPSSTEVAAAVNAPTSTTAVDASAEQPAEQAAEQPAQEYTPATEVNKEA